MCLLHNSNLVFVYLEDKGKIVNKFSNVKEIIDADCQGYGDLDDWRSTDLNWITALNNLQKAASKM